jgi:hypothetical protein
MAIKSNFALSRCAVWIDPEPTLASGSLQHSCSSLARANGAPFAFNQSGVLSLLHANWTPGIIPAYRQEAADQFAGAATGDWVMTAIQAVRAIGVSASVRSTNSRQRLRHRQPSEMDDRQRRERFEPDIAKFNRAPAPAAPAPLRIVLKPYLGPREGLDVTEAITRTVAQELWKLHGGNDVMNWLEAERLVQEFFSDSRRTHPAASRIAHTERGPDVQRDRTVTVSHALKHHQ